MLDESPVPNTSALAAHQAALEAAEISRPRGLGEVGVEVGVVPARVGKQVHQ